MYLILAQLRELHRAFECFVTDVTAVGSALLVLAGLVSKEGTLLCETLLADVTAVGTLACVRPVVPIQSGW